MSLTSHKISKEIVRVSASTHEELAHCFARFQEYYESPELRGKIFTYGQMRAMYGERTGGWTYADDWGGFNIPSSVLDPFKSGLFDPLTPSEQELVSMFKDRRDKFYIIGCQENDARIVDHEISHALFFANEKYRNEVTTYLNANWKEFAEVLKMVQDLGYHPAVHLDEVHAYSGTDFPYLMKKEVFLAKKHHQKLMAIRDKHYSPKKK